MQVSRSSESRLSSHGDGVLVQSRFQIGDKVPKKQIEAVIVQVQPSVEMTDSPLSLTSDAGLISPLSRHKVTGNLFPEFA
jgi:hypothetical protein